MTNVDIVEMARAVLDAHTAYESSFDAYHNEYKADHETCVREACAARGIPEDAIALLLVADSWPRDIDEWAKKVLSKELSV